jgi:hypothetical protein
VCLEAALWRASSSGNSAQHPLTSTFNWEVGRLQFAEATPIILELVAPGLCTRERNSVRPFGVQTGEPSDLRVWSLSLR